MREYRQNAKLWIRFVCTLLFLTGPIHAMTNFVVIIADDCTRGDIGCYGGQAYTPNMDQLSKEGLRLTRCFQAAPMCSPTRHNIYTGLYPVKSGAFPNHTRAYDHVKSIGHYLGDLGYRVALSGKTHINPKSVFPFEYSGKKNPDMVAIDKLFGECAESKKPFCLFACSNEPHSPWNKGDASRYPPDKVKLPPFLADTSVMRENFSRYLAEITYFDDQVGQILKLLDKHQLQNDTLVMVVSEQGNGFPMAKWTCYEAGLASAMVVRWPEKIQPASKTNAMVEYTDITPTLVEIAGGKVAAAIDGRSFLPVLLGERQEHKSHVYGIMTTRGIKDGSECYPIRCIRDSRYRLIWNLNFRESFKNTAMRTDFYRSFQEAADAGQEDSATLISRYERRPEFELYDLDSDPYEMKNLADRTTQQERLAELKSRLGQWMTSQNDLGIQTEMLAKDRQRKRSK